MDEQSYKHCKCLMIFFNIAFLVGGLVLLGLGIWVVVDFQSFSSTLNAQSLLFQYAAYIAIIIGGATVILSLCGCIGAWKESPCLIRLFIFFVVLFVLAEVAMLVLVFAFTSDFERLLSEGALDSLKQHYGTSTAAGKASTVSWDFTQTTVGCCGFHNGTDYVGSVYDVSTTTANPWPLTCCRVNGVGGYLNGDFCLANADTSAVTSSSYANIGCYAHIRDRAVMYAGVVGGVAGGVMLIQILAITFACCVSSNINRHGKVEDWDY